MMSALQAGTARGRRDAATPLDSATAPPDTAAAVAARPVGGATAAPPAVAPASSADAPVADPGSTDSGRDA